MYAIAVSHTSFKLKGQIELAIPTAIPVFELTKTEGKEHGKSEGSSKVLS